MQSHVEIKDQARAGMAQSVFDAVGQGTVRMSARLQRAAGAPTNATNVEEKAIMAVTTKAAEKGMPMEAKDQRAAINRKDPTTSPREPLL